MYGDYLRLTPMCWESAPGVPSTFHWEWHWSQPETHFRAKSLIFCHLWRFSLQRLMCLGFQRDIFDWKKIIKIEQLQNSVVTHQVLYHFNQKPTKVLEENLILSLHHTFWPKWPHWNICSLRGKCFHWSCHGTSWSWSKLPADLWNLYVTWPTKPGPQKDWNHWEVNAPGILIRVSLLIQCLLMLRTMGQPSQETLAPSEKMSIAVQFRLQIIYVLYPLLSMFEDCYYGLESGKACKADQQCGCHFPQTLRCQGLNYSVKTALAY